MTGRGMRRGLAARGQGLLWLAVAALGTAGALPAHAAVVTNVGCGANAGVDLVNAITAAATGDTLVLSSYCVYTLTSAASGDDGLPPISKLLTIQGNHATIQRSPSTADRFRILDVAGEGHVIADTLTIMNGAPPDDDNGGGVLVQADGELDAQDVNIQGNGVHGTGLGGGVSVAGGGTANLTGGQVKDNRATASAGGLDAEGTVSLDGVLVTLNRAQNFGGGLHSGTGDSQITLTHSTFSSNHGGQGSGAIDIDAGTVQISGTTVKNNTAAGFGLAGGIFSAGNLTVTDSRVEGNTGTSGSGQNADGGGLDINGGTASLTDTVITGNRLVGEHTQGAGIVVYGGTLTLTNSAVTNNLGSGRYAQGGGVYADNTITDTALTLDHTTVSGNKVTGTGSVSGGLYTTFGTGVGGVSLVDSHITGNSSPSAPAPGGVWTDTQYTVDGLSTITGNTPTNCLLSPVIVTGCVS